MVAAALTFAVFPAVADARFTDPATASLTATADTLSAPTGLSVSTSCGFLTSTITVRWTATTDLYVTGYQLLYTKSGADGTPQAIAGRTTTSASYSITNGLNYKFAMISTYRNWTSDPSAYTATVRC